MKNETFLNQDRELEFALLGEALIRGGISLPDNQTAFQKKFKDS